MIPTGIMFAWGVVGLYPASDPVRPIQEATMKLEDRFWSKVKKGPGCWRWMGSLSKKGYGLFWKDGKIERAHRAAWQLIRGPIPPKMQVLHSCDQPNCVNVSHLRLGTNADNVADRVSRGRDYQNRITHCPAGHPYEGSNLIVQKQSGRPVRMCRACRQKSDRERKYVQYWQMKTRRALLAEEPR